MTKKKNEPIMGFLTHAPTGISTPAKTTPSAKKRPPLVSCGYDEIPKYVLDAAWKAAPESVRAAFNAQCDD